MQQDTLLLCPNAVVNITNEMARKRKIFNFGMVKRLVLPLNVGKENGQTFIGTMNKSGSHWVLVVVEIRPFKRILYCETLAWKPPSDIIDVVNRYISHIPRIGKYDDTHLFLAHHPMATSRFGHMCDWRCRNYPLQTCSDVCGVIVLIIAALAAVDQPLFQFLIGPSEKSQVYLQRPSQHAYFLRRIIMCWFAESRIEINYVLLHHDWRDNVRTESDHSSCLRRDTSSSTRKKLKLSLNPKASSSNGSIPRATEEHASEDFPVNTAQVSSGSSSIPNSPMSSEETFSPPPKTPSSPNDKCAVPSCKKGSQSSSGKPRKVPRSSADLLSSAKKPQPFTCPDPTSPAQNNDPQACPQANPSEKSVSNSQPSPSTGPPAPAPASTQPTSQGTIAYDSSNADSADSVPPPNCEGMTRFQCELCGMNLSSRNCLYKHKKRKHKLTNRVDEDGGKDAGNKHVVCPECKEKQKR